MRVTSLICTENTRSSDVSSHASVFQVPFKAVLGIVIVIC